jgi:heat shock protein HslJ
MNGLVASVLVFVLLCALPGAGAQSPNSGRGTPEPGHRKPALNLAMGQWRFVSIGQKQVTTIGQQQPYLKFEDRTHTMTGFTGCNRLRGRYRASDSSLRFEQVVSTQRACAADSYEAEVLKVVNSVTGYRITDHELHLLGAKGTLAILMRPHEEQTSAQGPPEK